MQSRWRLPPSTAATRGSGSSCWWSSPRACEFRVTLNGQSTFVVLTGRGGLNHTAILSRQFEVVAQPIRSRRRPMLNLHRLRRAVHEASEALHAVTRILEEDREHCGSHHSHHEHCCGEHPHHEHREHEPCGEHEHRHEECHEEKHEQECCHHEHEHEREPEC